MVWMEAAAAHSQCPRRRRRRRSSLLLLGILHNFTKFIFNRGKNRASADRSGQKWVSEYADRLNKSNPSPRKFRLPVHKLPTSDLEDKLQRRCRRLNFVLLPRYSIYAKAELCVYEMKMILPPSSCKSVPKSGRKFWNGAFDCFNFDFWL